MFYKSTEFITPKNTVITVRSANGSDSEALIKYLHETATETRFLLREPEETALTVEKERDFLLAYENSPRNIMLLAFVGDRHAGNCSFCPVSEKSRCRHRCTLGIALYKKFCGLGIGTVLISEAIKKARECGYEQMELSVVTENTPAVSLYKKFGFRICGTMPHEMKYKDGTYADVYNMVLDL